MNETDFLPEDRGTTYSLRQHLVGVREARADALAASLSLEAVVQFFHSEDP